MRKTKVGMAMSGGVDSTACALLLRKQYDVHGFFMQLAQPDINQQLVRVKDIAARCKIPLTVIDLSARFEEKVLSYFTNTYLDGRTPNPCMVCNPKIKFGLFMDAMLEHGMEEIATGHYASIVEEDGCFFLQQGEDTIKDQTYFLARLGQKQLARVKFPLGAMTKSAVYDLVEEHGFTDFRGRESQDVCFLQNESVGHFLTTRSPESARDGDIVHINGHVLGRHNGIINYTVGQRRGLGIAAPSPLYVLKIDASANRVIVGDNDDLYQDSIEIQDVSWNCGKPPKSDHDYLVRIRYGHEGQPAKIKQISEDHYHISFTERQRAVTPGQFAVIYEGDRLIGSGEIQ
ncbi:tRNA 2-thiouridine(34) synthase MnmA [Desulfocapsa sulfexigens]|nr:tRNA 2-thiouridine(34) synthase MnmA [Desulfocapsa sulfexigens]